MTVAQWLSSGIIGILAITGLYLGIDRALDKVEIKAARGALEKNYAAVAADHLERPRRRMVKSEPNCQLLLNTYFSARLPGLLEWAAQACLNNGIDLPEAHIGLAAAREMSGRPQEALQILGAVVEKYKEIPDIFYRMAQILVRLNNAESAAVAYLQALQRAPDNASMLLEALEYMASQKMWTQAKPLADKLKSADTNNPALKLLVARVLMNSGDAEASKPLVESSRALLAQAPNRAQIEAAFADVLGSQADRAKK